MKVMQSLRQHAGLVVKWDLCLDGVYGKIHALGLSFLLLSVLPIRWFGRLKREGGRECSNRRFRTLECKLVSEVNSLVGRGFSRRGVSFR